MPKLPYMGFPFPYYKNTPKYSQNFPPSNFIQSSNNKCYPNENVSDSIYSSEPNIQNNCFNECKKNKSNNNTDYLFDLFGLKLYTDDVLLVSLIYFLYSEGVKDESLFIVLILLLLS